MSGNLPSGAESDAGGGFAAPKVLSTRVELAVKAKDLRNADVLSLSDPMCVLFIKETENQNFREHDRTEMIKNDLNPEWVHKFQVDYYFEEKQYLRFEVYDIDKKSPNLKHHDPLGYAECNLAHLVSNMSYKLQLKSLKGKSAKGTIEIQTEELSACKEIATLQWKATGLDKQSRMKKPKVWIEISKENHDSSWTLVWRSEKQTGVDVTWERFTLAVKDLSNGDDDRQLRVVCKDENNKSRPVGEFNTKWRNLSRGCSHANTYQLYNPQLAQKKGEKYKHSGTLELVFKSSQQENTFIDYIHGGMQIEVSVAIDFTRSNGDPSKPDSLHYMKSNTPNPYAQAISAVVSILEDYDTDKLIPAYGFGAIAKKGDQEASMKFPLNGNETDPSCFKVEGVMEAYQSALKNVTLHGPTCFAPIIEHVAKETSEATDGSKYGVLLIITDGVIDDMPSTIQAIIKASNLPLSIIIIGVGNENFKAMERLDSDHCLLSYRSSKAERDIVQFVAMKDFPGATSADIQRQQLAKEVLAEVPLQITSFMSSKAIHPKQTRQSIRVK